MDCAADWRLEDDLILSFTDQSEFPTSNIQPHCPFSSDGQFDLSFSSSTAAYDECYTPSRCDSFGISDLEGLSSSRTSLGSHGSNSPIGDPTWHSMACMEYEMRNETDSSRNFTPCQKQIMDQSTMNYDFSQASHTYGPVELQDDLCGLPGAEFNNLPELLFHESAISPVQMAISSNAFVIPSQMFISEPYRPTTPASTTSTKMAVLGSPLEEPGQSKEEKKFFMSPRETHLQTPSSIISSGSHSALERTPSIQTQEISTDLDRLQLKGVSRVSKKSKKPPRGTSKLGRVRAGAFRCDHVLCKTKSGFERHEHLKRHQRTHGVQILFQCEFCPKEFPVSRPDNYDSHWKLHAVNKKGSRTKYFPEAEARLRSWGKNGAAKRRAPISAMRHANSRRVKPSGLLKSKL